MSQKKGRHITNSKGKNRPKASQKNEALTLPDQKNGVELFLEKTFRSLEKEIKREHGKTHKLTQDAKRAVEEIAHTFTELMHHIEEREARIGLNRYHIMNIMKGIYWENEKKISQGFGSFIQDIKDMAKAAKAVISRKEEKTAPAKKGSTTILSSLTNEQSMKATAKKSPAKKAAPKKAAKKTVKKAAPKKMVKKAAPKKAVKKAPAKKAAPKKMVKKAAPKKAAKKSPAKKAAPKKAAKKATKKR